ncbi:hypothetical protein REB14_09920 [Chryseobacterium sp. ES2]|uniref:Lipoprotein n=1 Tax=Chryseobacterium metallicongregator TaxID=3073042 RepID=A0ABU1E3W4_9FLAO|nr:hypothetical protein [Chryseobacterium sp. ES2]MDR4952489.1 hypothetical protein [Chryseobacterium sp. ES2]
MKTCFNILLIAITLIFINCTNNKKDSDTILNSEKESNNITTTEKLKYNNSKIKKIDSKKELRNDGNFNQMTLFVVNNNISVEQLKVYCSNVKSNYTDGYFQILVFFKKSNSIAFPNNPLTGLYMEEKDLKNIKAIYTINNINGYSKLDYYEKNNWESIAQTVEIN